MTRCSTLISFLHLLKAPVTDDFEGGNITSDSGIKLLRRVDLKLDLTAQLVGCVVDRRDPPKVRH